MHLQKSLQKHTNLGLTIRDRNSTNLYTVDLDKPNPMSVKLYFGEKDEDIEVIGSCNGLLALLGSDDTITLYNPCTREHKILPFSPTELHIPSGEEYDSRSDLGTHYGFGYDPVNEDYKVVKIIDYYDHTLDRNLFSEFKVYSLKSNCWNRIKDSPYYFIIHPSYHHPLHHIGVLDGVFANGAVHWTGIESIYVDDWVYMIVAFDFGLEEFRIIPQSKDFEILYVYFDDYLDVGVLGGCLCLLHTKKCMHAQIWVMKENGVKESLSKLFTVVSHLQVKPFQFCVTPLAYSESEDKVLLELDNRFFVWYDLRRRKSELVNIEGAPERVATEIFVGSLVTLNSGGGGGSKIRKRKRSIRKTKFRLEPYTEKSALRILQ